MHIEFTSNMVVWFHAKFADVTTPRVLMLLMGAGDRSWSRSCSVRHRSNSRPMLAIGDSAASTAASAAAALGRKKSRSSSDAGSSRRSRSGSSGQDAKKLSASADDDDDDSGYGNYRQLNTFLQGPRILFVHLSYTCYAAYTHVTSRHVRCHGRFSVSRTTQRSVTKSKKTVREYFRYRKPSMSSSHRNSE